MTSPITPIPAAEQLRTALNELGDARAARDAAEKRAESLASQLEEFRQANTAFTVWEKSTHNSMMAHVAVQNQLRAEVLKLKKDSEALNSMNLDLSRQVENLKVRNASVNAAAARFREDLWHSEMRWRDAFSKGVQLEESVKTLKG